MDAESTYLKLKTIALEAFSDIVESASLQKGPFAVTRSLRIFFYDGSFLEIWISNKKYSYHWQKNDGTFYRHDNAPHKSHQQIKTFPKHFHNGSRENVRESDISDDPLLAMKQFLTFIKEKTQRI
ncbi:MAG: DUF6516 family protein [Nanoarchaeota archaeon]